MINPMPFLQTLAIRSISMVNVDLRQLCHRENPRAYPPKMERGPLLPPPLQSATVTILLSSCHLYHYVEDTLIHLQFYHRYYKGEYSAALHDRRSSYNIRGKLQHVTWPCNRRVALLSN